MTRRLGVPLVVNDRPDLARARRGGLRPRRPGRPAGRRRAAASASPSGSRRTRRPRSTRPRPTTSASAPSTRRRRRRAGPPSGSSYVRYAAAHARQPWFAIGGIDETNVGDVVAAGADADRRRPRDRRRAGPRARRGGACASTRVEPLRYTWPKPFDGRSPVAQLAEHPAVNRRVVGSSPTRGSPEKSPANAGLFFSGSLNGSRSTSTRARP